MRGSCGNGVEDPIRDMALKAFVLPVKGAKLTTEEVESTAEIIWHRLRYRHFLRSFLSFLEHAA